ncbi:hypothetical protein F442_15532 [Phytophthora nicotianae P10297]|uniref:Uncharacterized protein n=1 Tax=Phytophthora nicotianae P10297 TaxID=1317064 RepID=W2YPI0_PHYNI|nr:hypothetical protein F442_15532 [Phytophthora nicotianae P10297]
MELSVCNVQEARLALYQASSLHRALGCAPLGFSAQQGRLHLEKSLAVLPSSTVHRVALNVVAWMKGITRSPFHPIRQLRKALASKYAAKKVTTASSEYDELVLPVYLENQQESLRQSAQHHALKDRTAPKQRQFQSRVLLRALPSWLLLVRSKAFSVDSGHFNLTSLRCSEIGTITPAPCPAGTYGATPGLMSSACSSICSTVNGVLSCVPSPCPAGYYCPLATTVPLECGAVDKFCPKGSSAPTTATAGYYTTWKVYTGTSFTGEQLALQYVEGNSLAIQNQTTRSNHHICDKGSYCSGGVKRLCPAGTYGATDGLSTAACTAPCPAGFYW